MATMTKSKPESKSLTRFKYLLNKYVNLEKWMSSEDELEYFIYYKMVYETIPSKVNVADFFAIISFDPTTRLNGITEDYITMMLQNKAISLSEQGSNIKVGEYSKWLIKQFLNVESNESHGTPRQARETLLLRVRFIEDLYKVRETLTKFHRFKNRLTKDNRDINKLTIGDLEFLMLGYSLEKTKATAEEKDSAKSSYSYPGSEIVFKGLKWTVVKISELNDLAKNAACFFGGYDLKPTMGETAWCTASPGTYNRYNYHAEKGPLYVVLPNECDTFGKKTGLPSVRYQFHFQTNQFMDQYDKNIELVQYLNDSMSELKEFFKPEFAVGLTENGGEELVIDNFEHGVIGSFIKLYGLEDLFNILPDTLTKIHIKNNSKYVSLKVPSSIGRFKNLTSIYLKNCISEIPREIADLKNLVFLALEKNSELTSIPDEVINLPKLLFINLKGCENLKLSKFFLNHSIQFMPDMWKGNAMV
jgi:hypothetical protein